MMILDPYDTKRCCRRCESAVGEAIGGRPRLPLAGRGFRSVAAALYECEQQRGKSPKGWGNELEHVWHGSRVLGRPSAGPYSAGRRHAGSPCLLWAPHPHRLRAVSLQATFYGQGGSGGGCGGVERVRRWGRDGLWLLVTGPRLPCRGEFLATRAACFQPPEWYLGLLVYAARHFACARYTYVTPHLPRPPPLTPP
jgi:hypothetical protein